MFICSRLGDGVDGGVNTPFKFVMAAVLKSLRETFRPKENCRSTTYYLEKSVLVSSPKYDQDIILYHALSCKDHGIEISYHGKKTIAVLYQYIMENKYNIYWTWRKRQITLSLAAEFNY